MEPALQNLLLILRYACWASFLSLVFSSFLFAPWLMTLGPLVILLSAGLALCLTLAGVRLLRRRPVIATPAWMQKSASWAVIVVCGAVLRLAWGLLVPATLGGDAGSFHETALRLLDERRYASTYLDVTGSLGREVMLFAWRPPGLPILLAGWYAAVGASQAAVVAFNTVVYLATALVLGAMASRMMGREAVFPVLALHALWPKLILLTAVPLTEGPSLLFLLLTVLAFDYVLDGRRAALLPAGLAYAAGALIRPSMLLMPAAWGVMASGARGALSGRVVVLVLASAIGVASIMPWSLRNHAVLGEFVLISTNGGDVLYRANNPLATGNFIPAGARDLNALIDDEVAWNRAGTSWAREWIADNPMKFLENAIRKLGYFWGWAEDGNSFRLYYPSLSEGFPSATRIADAAMNIAWLALLLLVAVALVVRRHALISSPMAGGLMASALLLSAVHAVYESHARYNMPILGILFLLAVAGPCLLPRRAD